jgi:hypothetical protein
VRPDAASTTPRVTHAPLDLDGFVHVGSSGTIMFVSSPEDFAASLQAAASLVEGARAGVLASREPATSAADRLSAVFSGSSQASAEAAVESFQEAQTRLAEALTALDRSASELSGYMADVLGGSGGAPPPPPLADITSAAPGHERHARQDSPPSHEDSGSQRQGSPLTPERLLQNPREARGREPEDLRQVLDEQLDPRQWTRATVKKGEGTRWFDRYGRSIAIERQGQVDDDLHRGWYLKVANNGRIERVPLAGNPTLYDNP